MEAAGFSEVEADTITEVSRAASAWDAAFAYCQGTPLRGEIEARDASLLEPLTARAVELIAERFGSGEVEAQIQGHVFAARA